MASLFQPWALLHPSRRQQPRRLEQEAVGPSRPPPLQQRRARRPPRQSLPLRSGAAASSSQPASTSTLGVDLVDWSDRLVPYEEAWRLQKQLVEQVAQAAAAEQGPSSSSSSASSGGRRSAGAAILLQHHPVYTLGAGATEAHLRFDPADSPLPLYRTERGGEVTYHGPGQLVLYPILNLRLFQPDLHWYLRNLEEVVIRALEEVSGLEGGRVAGLTGVWVGGAKVAAIGVRASRWVTYHGLALNVAMDLGPFQGIVPCGIADRGVTSVQQLLVRGGVGVGGSNGVHGAVEGHGGLATAESREGQQLLEEYRHGLLAAFEEVFGVELQPAADGELVAAAGAKREAAAQAAGLPP